MTEPAGRIWVQTRYRFSGVSGVASGDDTASFEIGDGDEIVRVELRRSRMGDPEFALELSAVTERNVSPKRRDGLEKLARGELPDGVTASDDVEYFNAAGMPTLEVVPDSLTVFFQETLGVLAGVCRKCATALRWRLGLYVPLRGMGYLGSEFSLDGTRWTAIPTRGSVRVSAHAVGQPLGEYVSIRLAEVVGDQRPVPAAHALLFEAQELATRHDRSALVISLAALEVGVKELISALLPEAQWLLENLASPPIERLICDYLPTMPVRAHLLGASSFAPSESLRNELRKAVRLRNELVHVGRDLIDPHWLDDWLALCESLLYAFDCFSGWPWAGEFVDDEHRVLIVS